MALITPYWGLDGIILFLSAIAGFYVFMTRRFKYRAKRGVLEVTPTAFAGNLGECFLLKKSPAEVMVDIYNYGKGLPYVGFYIFDKPCLMLRDPELVKHVLVKDFNYFPNQHLSADDDDVLGSANLFIVKNPAWKIVRSKLTPVFTSGKLKKMFELMLDVAKDLDAYLESLNLDGEGQEIDIKEMCGKFTTDLIATTAYGLRVNSLNNPDAEFRRRGREIFSYNIPRMIELTALFFAPGLIKPFRFKFFTAKNATFLREVFWDTIQQRIKSGEKRNDLVDLLVELKKNYESNPDQDIFKFDGDNLVAQAAVFFTGGFETSSTLMSFALYELAVHPEIQNKLRSEITAALQESGGKITYEMVTSSPYLDKITSEVLRRYPPLPFLDRVAIEDYEIPGSNLVLKKGTPVYVPMLALHYDPKYFPDPEKFDPERFSEEKKKERPAYTYLPFGEGPHICIGLRLGLIQSKLGLIQILSKYEVTPSKTTQIPMIRDPKGVFTSPLGGIKLTTRKITTKAT